MLRRYRVRTERIGREGMRSERRHVAVVQVDGNSFVESQRSTGLAQKAAISSARSTDAASVKTVTSTRSTCAAVKGPAEIVSLLDTGFAVAGGIKSLRSTDIALRGPVISSRTTTVAIKKTVASFHGSNVDQEPIGTTSVAVRLGIRDVESVLGSSLATRGAFSSTRSTGVSAKQGVGAARSTGAIVKGPVEIFSYADTSVALRQGVGVVRATGVAAKSKMGPIKPVARIKLRAPRRVRIELRT